MSEKALPLLFINLGGEMLYVLDQRLNAQKVQIEKAKKIMSDIILNMFSDGFLDEIFRPQELCSRRALKTIFERLAHTSIMRLNETSMDKLFDLMTMAVKYQICLCSRPKEIFLVTLNHFDSIRNYVKNVSNAELLMANTYKRLNKTYSHMNEEEFQFIRQTILQFFQDLRIKVSIFLKDNVQNWNGSFILPNGGALPHNTAIPGTIVYYDENDESSVSKTIKFNPGTTYKVADKEGSFEEYGDRVTKLGLNIYLSVRPADTTVQAPPGVNIINMRSDVDANIPDPKAKAQLDLLCKLIGTQAKQTTNFKLDLFNDDEEEFIYVNQSKNSTLQSDADARIISFDQSKRVRDERLKEVMQEFDDYYDNKQININKSKNSSAKVYDSDEDDDLCTLMDRFNK